jgi:protease-4
VSKKGRIWLIVVIVAVLVAGCGGCGLLAIVLNGGGANEGWSSSAQTIAVIEVNGTIEAGDSNAGTSVGAAYADRVIADLQSAIDDPSVVAIVLAVNSPGGSVVGSADIHRALWECPKPLVTSMGETAASGGYYIACATDYIIARPGTVTGSIGVISQYIDASDLLGKLGISSQTIKSGVYKDQGSLYRELTEDEVAMMQTMVDEMYEEFVAVVAEGRGMEPADVRAVADGRVFTGRQAVDLGLVDAEGNLDDAVAVAAQLAGLDWVPPTVSYTAEPTWLDALMGYASQAGTPGELALLREMGALGEGPGLQYLYAAP